MVVYDVSLRVPGNPIVAGGIVLTAALAQLQTLFIAASIPILAVMPFIIASRLEKNVCDVSD